LEIEHMRVFVTGATGWVGSAVVNELLGAGHQVTGLARSDEKAAALASTGAKVLRGTLDDLDALRNAASAADAVIHTAFNHDFSKWLLLGSGVVRPGPGNEVEDLWCASESERR
jgi:nucleoside-diphosphate-sugar epimerase